MYAIAGDPRFVPFSMIRSNEAIELVALGKSKKILSNQ
jgi:hypothetical protein